MAEERRHDLPGGGLCHERGSDRQSHTDPCDNRLFWSQSPSEIPSERAVAMTS